VSTLSTHVLDTTRGEPADGIVVRLEHITADGEPTEIGRGVTDADGRVSNFGVLFLPAGSYRLVFETGPYFSAVGVDRPFFPEVVVTFQTDGQRPKYHVPLLLGAYSYTTYRGS
jgi:5-hydroxyisourate hydrolase